MVSMDCGCCRPLVRLSTRPEPFRVLGAERTPHLVRHDTRGSSIRDDFEPFRPADSSMERHSHSSATPNDVALDA